MMKFKIKMRAFSFYNHKLDKLHFLEHFMNWLIFLFTTEFIFV